VRVFLDTNVLVAAIAARGLCADLLRGILAGHELVVSEVVLAELRRVLTRRVGVSDELWQEIDRFIRGFEVVACPSGHLGLGLRDPDDEWIVASAVAAHADLLVTGDADILVAGSTLPVLTLTPRQSWNVLRGGR